MWCWLCSPMRNQPTRLQLTKVHCNRVEFTVQGVKEMTKAWHSGYQASGLKREVVGEEWDQTLKREVVEKFDEETEAHLARYIVNRNKRTGKVWEVVKRYTTLTGSERYNWKYMRAVVSDGEVNVRIYHKVWNWVRA